MRGVISVVTITALLLLLTGCGGNTSVNGKNNAVNSTKKNTRQEASIDKEINDNKEDKITEGIDYIQKNYDEKTENQDAEVIAKSNNVVTSKEKEEILNEIDQMLDDVLDNINQMDELEDDDLILEE